MAHKKELLHSSSSRGKRFTILVHTVEATTQNVKPTCRWPLTEGGHLQEFRQYRGRSRGRVQGVHSPLEMKSSSYSLIR